MYVKKKMNRQVLLSKLELVQPGLARWEIVEQATSYIFKDGSVFTYNEEVACRADSGLAPEFTGAVQSTRLLAVLKRLEGKNLDIRNGDGRLILESVKKRDVGGKRVPYWRARLALQKSVRLPMDKVEMPTKWRKLPHDFPDAVKIVSACIGKDTSRWDYTCVHVSPNFVEASDTKQAIRYSLKTGFKDSILVPGKSIRPVGDLAVTGFAETEKWVHFRMRDEGLVYSCLRYQDKFKVDLGKIMAERGEKTELPDNLDKAADAGRELASESDDKLLRVRIKDGFMRVRGVGVTGDIYVDKEMRYDGDSMEFVITPELLAEIGRRAKEAEITKPNEKGDRKLRVDGGKWVYVASLVREDDKHAVGQD
jgi:hypothetical protein